MPATAAQVFGPTTVTVDYSTTGEKTLLTMNTTLPAGGKNIILAVFKPDGSAVSREDHRIRIYKGTTLLYGSLIDQRFNNGGQRAKVYMIIAVDNNPTGNDTYTFTEFVPVAEATSATVHVQGIVIKSDDAVWGYNTAVVSVANGATATLTSISTSFPAGSKVAIIAVVYGSHTTSGHYLIGAGNARIKVGATVVSSNQFAFGSDRTGEPGWVHLLYLDSPTTATQTYSVEVYNNSGVAFNFAAEIVAFTVFDGAFLDTASVALTNGVQVTVGSLNTTLTGDVVAMGFAAAENTGTAATTAFNAGDVVLQLNNSATGQIANRTGWILEQTGFHGRSGVLPLFRIDTNVTNPSYQIKMTARASGINGEAKILAFTLFAPVLVTVTDSGTGVETVSVTAQAFVADSATGAEAVGLAGSIAVVDSGSGVEVADLRATVFADDAGTGVDFSTAGIYQPVDDAGSGVDAVTQLSKEVLDTGVAVELVSMSKEARDAGAGLDIINSPVFLQLSDLGAGVELPVIVVPQSDAGAGADVVNMVKEALDAGSGVDAVLFVSREVLDIGMAIELPTAITSIPVLDSGTGLDVIGIIAAISVIDAGAGVEEATRTLSMFGDVTIDEMEIIGLHSIPYNDLVRDGLPIQVQRNAATDFVYIDTDQVGDILVEWEDRVADVYRGRRTITVMGLVRIVD